MLTLARPRLVAFAGLACLALSTATALAQSAEPSAENKAAARDIAIEGVAHAQAGRCKEALPLLQKAESLYHAPTILTWIGECQIQEGSLVEGTENLNRVVRENLPADAPPAFLSAQERARTLLVATSPRIGRLTIEVSPTNVKDLVVTVDGNPIAPALVGAPRPTDPGAHEIVARAPGYLETSKTLDLAEGGRERLHLELTVDPSTPPPTNFSGSSPSSSGGSARATWGWVTMGVGGALLAGGGVTGLMALGAKNDLDCGTDKVCTSQADVDRLNEANTLALTSTILFGVGGAAVATGLVLLLTGSEEAPSAEIAGAKVRPLLGVGSVGFDGTF